MRPWPSRKNEVFHPIAARFALAMTKNALLPTETKISCFFNSLLHPNTFFIAYREALLMQISREAKQLGNYPLPNSKA